VDNEDTTLDASEDSLGETPWISEENRSMRCRVCQLPRVFHRRRTRHSLHFLLAFATLGIWLPVWGIVIIHHLLRPWTCTVCRTHQRS
jgi:hypothetical protein